MAILLGYLSRVFLFLLIFSASTSICEAKGAITALFFRLSPTRDRNYLVYLHLWLTQPANSFDVVLFHENCSAADQGLLQSYTPKMPLIFINVMDHFENFRKRVPHMVHGATNPICPANPGSERFGFGYKMMCWFWFKTFQDYLPKEYDWMLRLDADVFLYPVAYNLPLFTSYNENNDMKVATSVWSVYNATSEIKHKFSLSFSLTDGMNQLARDFLLEKNMLPSPHWTDANGTYAAPFTNLLYIDMKWLRSNQLVQDFMYKVEQSMCIVLNRWGDLELWGYIVSIAQVKKHLLPIAYLHGSHNFCLVTNKYALPNITDKVKRVPCDREHLHLPDITD